MTKFSTHLPCKSVVITFLSPALKNLHEKQLFQFTMNCVSPPVLLLLLLLNIFSPLLLIFCRSCDSQIKCLSSWAAVTHKSFCIYSPRYIMCSLKLMRNYCTPPNLKSLFVAQAFSSKVQNHQILGCSHWFGGEVLPRRVGFVLSRN